MQILNCFSLRSCWLAKTDLNTQWTVHSLPIWHFQGNTIMYFTVSPAEIVWVLTCHSQSGRVVLLAFQSVIAWTSSCLFCAEKRLQILSFTCVSFAVMFTFNWCIIYILIMFVFDFEVLNLSSKFKAIQTIIKFKNYIWKSAVYHWPYIDTTCFILSTEKPGVLRCSQY